MPLDRPRLAAALGAFVLFLVFGAGLSSARAETQSPRFKVLAFYTAKHDLAHISFVNEANVWFPKAAKENRFSYESTDDWTKLNPEVLARYQVVLFLDTRPEDPAQRKAFEAYMKKGGSWMGFHFAGFALTPTEYPQNWDWYHNEFLGVGSFKSNTWRPTSAVLRVEDRTHPATTRLPATFKSQPNEWYRWQLDLRNRPDIKILMSIDPTSFPLGTGPKLHEIWHEGYYPVVWTNTKYKMLYVNMGHNDMDYGNTNKQLSSQFGSETQNRFIIDALLWLGGAKSPAARRGER
jgi:uncharacterized protein